jgi:ATP-dependent DNA helicase RecG
MILWTKEELIERLNRFEWKDVEFKLAQRGVSQDAYKSVSAFSNTEGGYLVFGIKESYHKFEIVGVIEVDKVQNDFISCLRTGDKLSSIVSVEEDTNTHEDKTLLIFYIPEANRDEKPVYLNGDIRKSYIRRGGSDEQCNRREINGFLRDSADSSYDSQIISEIDVEDFYDSSTISWYRSLINRRLGDKYISYSDIEFLNEMGFVVESDKELFATRAGILVFGKSKYVSQIVPRIIVDFQRIDFNQDEWMPEKRWNDRLVLEDNLITAWRQLFDRYSRIAELPFSLDETTQHRHSDPPDYLSFREAVINLLIHQDYGDTHRKAEIKLFKDKTVFWNPGNSFSTLDSLLEGTEKEVRNPLIVRAFRQIGLSEQSGTGIRTIMADCRKLGYAPAIINSDKSGRSFELVILKEKLVTEQQILFQSQLGVALNDLEAAIFAFVCRNNFLSITDVKAITGLSGIIAIPLLKRLETQILIQVIKPNHLWKLAEHLVYKLSNIPLESLVTDQPEQHADNLVTDQPPSPSSNLVTDQVEINHSEAANGFLTNLSEKQKKIILMCEVPRKQAELMEKLKVTHRVFFLQNASSTSYHC